MTAEQKSNEPYTITLDDDSNVHKLIGAATGMKSLPFTSSEKLLNVAAKYHPKAAFIDVHLENGESGLDVVPELRKIWLSCPIIIITADEEENTITEALSTGADDFIHKPIKPNELLARFQIRLRDVEAKLSRQEVKAEDLVINLAHSSVKSAQGERYMSPTEMNLLMAVVQVIGTVVPRNALKRQCWGRVIVSESALDRKVHEVRKVIKALSKELELKTVYGKGIILQVQNKTS